ncbi:MAG: CvpA family protein [Patescibacteria group bacterium]
MPIFDLILLFILAGFVFYGLFFGFIRTIGSLTGVILGIFIAKRFYLVIFNLLNNLFFGFNVVGKIVCFFVLFLLVYYLIGFVFSLLDKALNILSIIPFLKIINRLMGAIFGFIEGGLVLGLILHVMTGYFSKNSLFTSLLNGSQITPFLLGFINKFLVFLPGLINKL